MIEKSRAQVFGPGFPSNGALVGFDLSDFGIRVETKELSDGTPRWNVIQLAKSGWDGRQLRLEWKGSAGTYSLMVSDAEAIAAVRKFAGGKAQLQSSGVDKATRGWSTALIAITVFLPLLLIGGIVWQHDRIAAWAVGLISIEQEAKLGEIIFSQHKRSLKLIEGESLAMVKDIGAKLTANSRHKFQFHVAEDKSVNAFAMPGGFVVVHTGLLLAAATPEEVAGVLAHEVQHVEQRHSLRRIAQSLGLSAALSLVFGDLSGLASMGGDLLQLKFSRDHETEADREGLKVLVAAKINPAGMRDFFGKLAEQSKLDLGFLSTHPASAERMADIDRLIKALPEEARQAPPLAYDYAAIKALIGPRK
jgi:predicted Zn-dependent protease